MSAGLYDARSVHVASEPRDGVQRCRHCGEILVDNIGVDTQDGKVHYFPVDYGVVKAPMGTWGITPEHVNAQYCNDVNGELEKRREGGFEKGPDGEWLRVRQVPDIERSSREILREFYHEGKADIDRLEEAKRFLPELFEAVVQRKEWLRVTPTPQSEINERFLEKQERWNRSHIPDYIPRIGFLPEDEVGKMPERFPGDQDYHAWSRSERKKNNRAQRHNKGTQ